jgi:type I restriction enzyme, S subunit
MAGEEQEITLYQPKFYFGCASRQLLSVASWENGLAFKDSDFSSSGLPVVKIKEIKSGLGRDTNYTAGTYDKRALLSDGDLLLCWSGSPETSIGTFRWWKGPAWLNQHVFKVTPLSDVSADFLRHLLHYLQPNFIQIAKNKQTTGLGHVTKVDLRDMKVQLPSLEVQQSISAVLNPIDDKIELNRRMAATLEEMARVLFKSWFVDFDPVRAKAEGRDTGLPEATAALFPCRFGDYGMPEGWADGPMLDQANWVNGAAYKDMHFSDAADALPVVKIAELKNGLADSTKWTNTDLGEKYRITDGELLFAWSGSPDTSIDTFVWVNGEAWLNQHIFAVRTNGSASSALLYAMLKFFKPDLIEIARDKQTTGLGHVTRQDLNRLKVNMGNVAVRSAFNKFVEPTFRRLQGVLKETKTLASLRDTLLPKLISGELRIKDVQAAVEAA